MEVIFPLSKLIKNYERGGKSSCDLYGSRGAYDKLLRYLIWWGFRENGVSKEVIFWNH